MLLCYKVYLEYNNFEIGFFGFNQTYQANFWNSHAIKLSGLTVYLPISWSRQLWLWSHRIKFTIINWLTGCSPWNNDSCSTESSPGVRTFLTVIRLNAKLKTVSLERGEKQSSYSLLVYARSRLGFIAPICFIISRPIISCTCWSVIGSA